MVGRGGAKLVTGSPRLSNPWWERGREEERGGEGEGEKVGESGIVCGWGGESGSVGGEERVGKRHTPPPCRRRPVARGVHVAAADNFFFLSTRGRAGDRGVAASVLTARFSSDTRFPGLEFRLGVQGSGIALGF